jgi:lysophospholipase L1-like esterase
LQVIDLFSLTKDHPEYFDDGVHPNAEGNKVIAGYLAEEICL